MNKRLSRRSQSGWLIPLNLVSRTPALIELGEIVSKWVPHHKTNGIQIEAQSNRRHLVVYAWIVLLVVQMGCVWHGESVDHLWGPTLFRVAAPPDSEAFLAEQVWLPLLIEGGSRWGITIGYFSKLLGIPLTIQQTHTKALQNPALSWQSLTTIPVGSWRISPFHVSITRDGDTEFVAKRVVGVQFSAGFDRGGSNLSFGLSRTTGFWPRPDALYLLEFSDNTPFATRFWVCDAKQGESLEPCLQEVLR